MGGTRTDGKKVIVFACAMDKRDHGVRACWKGILRTPQQRVSLGCAGLPVRPVELASPQPGVARYMPAPRHSELALKRYLLAGRNAVSVMACGCSIGRDRGGG